MLHSAISPPLAPNLFKPKIFGTSAFLSNMAEITRSSEIIAGVWRNNGKTNIHERQLSKFQGFWKVDLKSNTLYVGLSTILLNKRSKVVTALYLETHSARTMLLGIPLAGALPWKRAPP